MSLDVLLGLQWGDEGKGKIVDFVSKKYDIIARFQGGPNAGHTIIFNNQKSNCFSFAMIILKFAVKLKFVIHGMLNPWLYIFRCFD